MYRYDKPRKVIDNRISISKLFIGGLLVAGSYLTLVMVTL